MRSEDRDFFSKLKAASFSNPFSDIRSAVDLELTGLTRSSSSDEVLSSLMAEVARRLKSVQVAVDAAEVQLTVHERQLLRYGSLFYVFHLYCEPFDRLIDQQGLQEEVSCKVTFASDALQVLASFGFSRQDSLRIFSLFFQLRRAFYFISGIIGTSRCVQTLRETLWNNIFTSDVDYYDRYLWNRMEDFSTILLGETGTGKGMAAAAIGRSGYIPFDDKLGCFADSFARTFIPINLSQFPEQLIESELFGHKKGAFTGAVEQHKGVFSRCSPHGAIFLDEIGDVSVPVQIKLLHILQERNFTPVGSHKSEKFSGRVIAATNKSLTELRQQGKFRDDFYYRLCSDTIEIPPLHQRLEENPGELREILERTLQKILGVESPDCTEEIETLIRAQQPAGYQWPGNIRELEQCARQMLLKRQYVWQDAVETDQLQKDAGLDFSESRLTAQQLLTSYCSYLYKKLGTMEKVATQTRLDRRTVKKYLSYDSKKG